MISENINGHLALASLLRQFNRKERYWLLNDALGSPPVNISYRKRLKNLLNVDVPEDAWWTMDYHFDWLNALICFERGCSVESLSTPQDNAAHELLTTRIVRDGLLALDPPGLALDFESCFRTG